MNNINREKNHDADNHRVAVHRSDYRSVKCVLRAHLRGADNAITRPRLTPGFFARVDQRIEQLKLKDFRHA